MKQLEKDLTNVGLSAKEAHVYLLLATNGEQRINELVSLTKHPRTSLYEILKSLETKALIERFIGEKFVTIKASPLTVYKTEIEQKIAELKTRKSKLDSLNKELVSAPGISNKSVSVRYYKGVPGARQLFWNSLSTTGTVCVFSAYGRSKFVGDGFYGRFVKESKNRSVKEKVIINPTDRALNFIKNSSNDPLARTSLEDIRVVSQDDVQVLGETFIYNNIYAHVYLDSNEINGFEIESEHFVATQYSIFETLWKNARSVAELFK